MPTAPRPPRRVVPLAARCAIAVPWAPGDGAGTWMAHRELLRDRPALAAKAKAPHVRDMGCFAAFVIIP